MRLFVAVLGIAAAPLLFVAIWGRIEFDIEGALRANTQHAAQATVDLLAEHLDAESFERKLDDLAARHVVNVRIVDGQGAVTTVSDHDYTRDWVHTLGTWFFGGDDGVTVSAFDRSLGEMVRRPESVAALSGDAAVGCRLSEGSRLLVCHAVRRATAADGTPRLVYVQESTGRAARRFYDLRYQVARLSLLTIPLAIIIGEYLRRTLLRPIEQLRRQALSQAAAAEPEATLRVPGREDEIGDLIHSFQALLTKLDEKRGSNERFMVDLVHELKSPLAAILVTGEHLSTSDDPKAARLSEVLQSSAQRLQALVTDVLDLARVEGGMHGEAFEDLDLAALVRAVVDAARLKVPGVSFMVEGTEELRLRCVPGRVESLVRNLVDNAADFAEQGRGGAAVVTVRCAQEGDDAVLTVCDTGPGIGTGDLFQRFYTRRKGGTGLGLAIVKAVVVAHGGDIVAENAPGGGASFRARIPTKP